MEPASVTSPIDVRLIRTLAKMALRVLEQGRDAPSSESPSRVSPGPKGTQETSCDRSRAQPDGDGGEDAGTARRSPTGVPLAVGSADDVPPA
jgi:hypothetical protein